MVSTRCSSSTSGTELVMIFGRLLGCVSLTGQFDETIAKTLLVLILKVDNPVYLKNFRPISLCNMVYKVITKVIVNRLRTFLDDLIFPLQSNFIPKRGTSDNAILAQEVVHFMHRSKS